MPLLEGARIINNLIVLGILLWIISAIYSKMDKQKLNEFWEKIGGLFGSVGKKNG